MGTAARIMRLQSRLQSMMQPRGKSLRPWTYATSLLGSGWKRLMTWIQLVSHITAMSFFFRWLPVFVKEQ